MGHPAYAVWALLLVALLALLPCAGRAGAMTAEPPAGAATTMVGPTTVTTLISQSSALHSAHPQIRTGMPVQASTQVQASTRTRAGAQAPARTQVAAGPALTWCSADGEHPRPGDGCSNQPFRGANSQLPNPPPQPTATVPGQLVLERAVPGHAALTAQVGPDHAPDLHALQVHRT